MEKEQYEKNLHEIKHIVSLMNEKSDAISKVRKDNFANAIKQDIEIMTCLMTKREMSIEIQERFLDILREIVSDFYNA
jgi:hypothetical protein